MKRTRPSEAFSPLPARITVRVPLTIHRRGGRKRIISPVGFHQQLAKPVRVDNAAIKALARAFHWRTMIETGQYSSITELAKGEKINESYASRILRLTLLSPDIVQAVIDGSEPDLLVLNRLMTRLPIAWKAQINEIWEASSA